MTTNHLFNHTMGNLKLPFTPSAVAKPGGTYRLDSALASLPQNQWRATYPVGIDVRALEFINAMCSSAAVQALKFGEPDNLGKISYRWQEHVDSTAAILVQAVENMTSKDLDNWEMCWVFEANEDLTTLGLPVQVSTNPAPKLDKVVVSRRKSRRKTVSSSLRKLAVGETQRKAKRNMARSLGFDTKTTYAIAQSLAALLPPSHEVRIVQQGYEADVWLNRWAYLKKREGGLPICITRDFDFLVSPITWDAQVDIHHRMNRFFVKKDVLPSAPQNALQLPFRYGLMIWSHLAGGSDNMTSCGVNTKLYSDFVESLQITFPQDIVALDAVLTHFGNFLMRNSTKASYEKFQKLNFEETVNKLKYLAGGLTIEVPTIHVRPQPQLVEALHPLAKELEVRPMEDVIILSSSSEASSPPTMESEPGEMDVIMLSDDDVIMTPAVEAQHVESQPVESQPVEAQPVEAQPVESQPVEAQPVEAQPVEAQPVEPVDEATVLALIMEGNVPLTRFLKDNHQGTDMLQSVASWMPLAGKSVRDKATKRPRQTMEERLVQATKKWVWALNHRTTYVYHVYCEFKV